MGRTAATETTHPFHRGDERIVLLSGGPGRRVPSRRRAAAPWAGIRPVNYESSGVGSGNGNGSLLSMDLNPLPGWA